MRRGSLTILLFASLWLIAGGAAKVQADVFAKNKYDAAAKKTASGRLCKGTQPFYWEVGNTNELLASGSYGQSDAKFNIDLSPRQQSYVGSAGAWFASAWLIEKAMEKQKHLTSEQIDLLRMRSPYTTPLSSGCANSLTIKSCFGNLGGYRKAEANPPDEYPFYFGPAHLQKLAMDLGLGSSFASHLRQEILETFGRENYYYASYETARLFDGLRMSPEGYARFLRDTMAGKNHMSELLGTHSGCAYNAGDCKNDVIYAGAPPDKRWRYSLGHWVETDTTRGKGAFSAFSMDGYYVWISADKTLYGIVAPMRPPNQLKNEKEDLRYRVIDCGRAIREAYISGIEQTESELPCDHGLCWDGSPDR